MLIGIFWKNLSVNAGIPNWLAEVLLDFFVGGVCLNDLKRGKKMSVIGYY